MMSLPESFNTGFRDVTLRPYQRQAPVDDEKERRMEKAVKN
jgi:hypothetical protein